MIIACDFDGTIVTHEYPKIGKPIPFAIQTLKKLQEEDHHQIILWTVREGDLLQEAINYCKSKGLEFAHVLIPFCDWKLEQGDILWCKPQEAPFNQLPIIPVDFVASQMKGTIYEKVYQHEHLQNMVDNLNLLYVAFTRAKDNMFVIGRRSNSGGRSVVIENCLTSVAKELAGSSLTGFSTDAEKKDKEKKKDPIFFEYGQLETKLKEKKKKTENVFLLPSTTVDVELESFPVKTSFKQSNQSRNFIEGDEEEERQ